MYYDYLAPVERVSSSHGLELSNKVLTLSLLGNFCSRNPRGVYWASTKSQFFAQPRKELLLWTMLDHYEYKPWNEYQRKIISKSSTVRTRNRRGQVIAKHSPKRAIFQISQTPWKMCSDHSKLFRKVWNRQKVMDKRGIVQKVVFTDPISSRIRGPGELFRSDFWACARSPRWATYLLLFRFSQLQLRCSTSICDHQPSSPLRELFAKNVINFCQTDRNLSSKSLASYFQHKKRNSEVVRRTAISS